MPRISLTALVILLVAHAGAAFAQSYNDALRDLGKFIASVDRAHAETASAAFSPLSLQRDAWRHLQQRSLYCAEPPIVNGRPTGVGPVGPFERHDGSDVIILTRGFAITWTDSTTRGVSLLFGQRFDARNGQLQGAPFLEGSYLAGKGAVPVGISGPDRWVDVPRTTSSPPLHQPWGPQLSALARHIRSCRIP